MSRAFRNGLISALLVLVAIPGVAAAQIDPYGGDPLELIAFADQSRVYTFGTDVIEVFTCDVPDGAVGVDLAATVATLNAELQPYFTWLSGGNYLPAFVAGASVAASQPSGWPDTVAFQSECESLAAQRSAEGAAGALIIVDAAYSGGYATAGAACETLSECPTTYPENGRVAVVGASTVVPSDGLPDARLSTVAHEIGHTLEFPHSFGGLTKFINGVTYEYDNPMDIMSGGSLKSLDVGTIAINRYAAGWTTDSVAFHRGDTATYDLAVPSLAGSQMLVLPTDTRGVFTVIGPRAPADFDRGIAVEGVEVYKIDQSGSRCGVSSEGACWGVDRRTASFPALDDPEGVAHVFRAGQSFFVDGASVSVVSDSDGHWRLDVAGSTVSQRFVDDDGSVHEANISAVAALGVTKGCNPPMNSRFCPHADVTRAEMAVFLVRALGDTIAPTSGLTAFSDVSDDVWYSNSIARIAELGIATGYTDGTYRPNGPVSRGEMAVFLDRAFDAVAGGATRVPFVDVSPDAFYAPATTALFDSGVTLGCASDPLSFCPFDPVTRAEMASFLARIIAP